MALTTRIIKISLRFPTPVSSATVRFIPDLAAGDAQILLEKYYDATLGTSISGASNTAPIEISTSLPHGYTTGDVVTVANVGGNVAANGTWTITVVDEVTFELDGSDGLLSGAYTGGGTLASKSIYTEFPLPAFTTLASYINYRVQFPRESGVNEHYISVNAGDPIDLSDLLVQSLISGAGYNLVLGDLADVTINAPLNNQALLYEAATNQWKNKPLTATSFALGLTSGSVLFTNGSHILQDNAQFYWNDSTNRLGIGTNAPERKLHVVNATSFGQMRLAWDDTKYTDFRVGLAALDGSLYITPSSGGVKIDSASPSQFEVRYDSSNYLSTTVGATGIVTFNAVGSSGSFVFSNGVTVPNLNATATLLSNGYTEAVFGNAKLKLMDISGYGYLTVKWNETAGDNTLNIKVNGGDRTLNLNGDLTVTANNMVDKAEQVTMIVRNDEATTLTVGEVVYVSGASGEHVKVKRALATTDPLSANTLGVIIESIASGADGKMALHGVVTGVDTNAYNEGDSLYLSASVAGGVTTTRPTAPNHGVFVGYVTKKSGNGKIALHIQNGYELTELHDVYITSPEANHFLVYDNSVGETRWENRSPADARTAMGLGTMATQNANNVAITGGSITNISSIEMTSSMSVGDVFITTASLNIVGPSPDQILTSISATTYRSVKYQVQVTSGSDIHVTEIRVFHDGSNVYMTEYGTFWNTASLATFNASLDGGQLKLLATPTSGTKAFKILTQALKA